MSTQDRHSSQHLSQHSCRHLCSGWRARSVRRRDGRCRLLRRCLFCCPLHNGLCRRYFRGSSNFRLTRCACLFHCGCSGRHRSGYCARGRRLLCAYFLYCGFLACCFFSRSSGSATSLRNGFSFFDRSLYRFFIQSDFGDSVLSCFVRFIERFLRCITELGCCDFQFVE